MDNITYFISNLLASPIAKTEMATFGLLPSILLKNIVFLKDCVPSNAAQNKVLNHTEPHNNHEHESCMEKPGN